MAYKQLVTRLNKHGYIAIPTANGLWKHVDRRTLFTLCVDNFGVKYDSMEDLNHLIKALKENYEITVDMEGRQFCGLQLDWNYKAGYVDISMPGYVQKKIKNSITPSRIVHNMPHTNGSSQCTVENYSMQHLPIPVIS